MQFLDAWWSYLRAECSERADNVEETDPKWIKIIIVMIIEIFFINIVRYPNQNLQPLEIKAECRGGWWGLVRTQNPAGYKWSKLSELFSIVSRVKSGHVCTWSLCPSWSTCHQTSPDRRQGSMLDWWWCQVMFYRSRVKTNKYCQVS